MRKKLAESLKRINWDAPVADVRDALITIMQGYCGASADVAASLAAEFYDGLRERMIGEKYGAVLAPDYSDEAVDQYVRWAVQPLVNYGADGSQSVVDRLNERIGYEVKRSAGNTVFRNGERDPRKVRFARVPRGSKSYPHGCPFCQMLASRGFVYRNAKTAGEMNHFHADCQCMVVPGFGDNPTVEGYDPNEYMDRWQHPEKYADESQEPHEQEPMANLIDRRFASVSSIDEANERAAAFVDTGAYKAKVDMKGMSVDAANSMLKALDAVYSSYDVDPLRSIQRMNKRSREFKNSSAEAAYRWMIGDLYYNADYVKTPKAMAAHRKQSRDLLDEVLGGNLARLREKHAGQTSTIRYIDALERTGRATVSQSFDSFEEVTYAHELGHMLDDRLFRKSGFDRKASFEQFAGGISAYATSDVKEYMAESFSAFYAGELEHLDPDLVTLFRESMK
jgi:hypothetical protein